MFKSLGLALLATAAVCGVASGEDIEQLGEAFEDEMAQLEVDFREYAKTRVRETAALNALQEANRVLDEKLGDPSVSLTALHRLERELESKRQEALLISNDVTSERLAMYERMQRLDGLLSTIEAEGVDLVPAGAGVHGMWKISVPDFRVKGVLSLRQEREIVTGTFRMTNGGRGSVQGTLAGGRLELELVDAERGKIGVSKGKVDLESGLIEGTWQPYELSEPSRVEWSAQRLSNE